MGAKPTRKEEIKFDPKMKKVDKGWGYEIWICNEDREEEANDGKPVITKYCGKLLHMDNGKKLSWHYHVKKDEHFYVQSGRVKLVYGASDDLNQAEEAILEPGHRFHVTRKLRHRLYALTDSDIFEFSTTHYDDDSIRVEKGD